MEPSRPSVVVALVTPFRALYRELAADARLSLLELLDGTEAVRATNRTGAKLLFVLNHSAETCSIDVGAGSWRDLVGDRGGEGALELEPFGVALVSALAHVPVAAGEQEGIVDADR